MCAQILHDAQFFMPRESVAFPKLRRAIRAVQNKYRFPFCPDDMDMGGAVVVRVDHHPQAIEAKNSRHDGINNINPSGWECF